MEQGTTRSDRFGNGEILRTVLQGTRQVVRFNWVQYAVAIAGAFALGFALPAFGSSYRTLGLIAIGITAYFVISSLVATFWVYDASRLYDLDWLDRVDANKAETAVTLSAGFDEISRTIRRSCPSAQTTSLDFFDVRSQTESSIRRARAAQSQDGMQSCAFDSLPIPTQTADLITAFMSAHEIREFADRTILFEEVARALSVDGSCVVVEHLRDLPNMLAYGPGAWHFHSRASWLEVFRSAGLIVKEESSITPFVHVFVLRSLTEKR